MAGLIEFFQAGGFAMYPLLIFSLVMWVVVLEKWFALSKFRTQAKGITENALKLVKEKRIQEARGIFLNSHHLVARPHMIVLEHYQNKEYCLKALKRSLKESQVGLRRFMWILSTIASSAPFIGLFGTIVGIIKSFDALAVSERGGFSVVAAGLSEALITTATGIVIAVVALIFYNYFGQKVSMFHFTFQQKLEDFADHLFYPPTGLDHEVS